jgi:alkanesulfonate monooxygenase SsuD/methylene tetrahydromethanopterin reductase-like flavin-dependent oxidoreductase (luciferase family)
MFIAVHSHGYIDMDHEKAIKDYYPSIEVAMTKIGQERGWGPYTKHTYEHGVSTNGALYVGDPRYVAGKIKLLKQELGIHRFTMHIPVGPMSHEKIMQTIQLLGKEVRKYL